jgi:putative NADH-flavin reductase
MTSLVIFGATGYAGGNIANEALRRGHSVTAVSRSVSSAPEGAAVREGDIHDEELVHELAADADVLVVAIPARPIDGLGLVDAVPALIEAAAKHNARLGFVGGAGSLQVAEGGPRLVDTPQFHEGWKPEALSHAAVLESLRDNGDDADWFYVSPAALFGAFAPGEATGSYRTGADVLLTDADGNSAISGADYALAFVDEIDQRAHSQQRFTVAH